MTMFTLKVASLVLLLVTDILGAPCNISFSAECHCDKDAMNRLHVKCTYTKLNKINSILKNGNSTINIYSLNISNNSLSDLPEKYFQGINTLELLDLSHNSFPAMPTSLQTVAGISDLTLSHNEIKSVDLSPFVNLDSVRKLDVSHNQIRSVNSKELFHAKENLKKLDLSYNNISSLQPLALQTMENLKALNLEGNTQIIDINSIKFPKHLQTANLQSNGIKKIDYCNFAALRDLEVLELQGNDLSCSCELASLHRFINRNYQEDDLHHLVKPKIWQCVNGNNERINITELYTTCTDTKNTKTCQEAEVLITDMESEFLQSLSSFKLEKADRSDEDFEMKWTFLNSSLLFGYKIIVVEEDNGDIVYSSPILHAQTVNYAFASSSIKAGNFEICVQVLRNATSSVKQDCKAASISSYKVVIGILAGVVFLVPFSAILIFIVRTDKIKTKKYVKLVKEEEKKRAERGFQKKEKQSGYIVFVETSNGKTENASENKQTEKVTHTGMTSADDIVIDMDSENSTTESGLDNPAFSALEENISEDDKETTEENNTDTESVDRGDEHDVHITSSDSNDTDATECPESEITAL